MRAQAGTTRWEAWAARNGTVLPLGWVEVLQAVFELAKGANLKDSTTESPLPLNTNVPSQERSSIGTRTLQMPLMHACQAGHVAIVEMLLQFLHQLV